MCKKCICSIVPPNVLSGLSKKGNESAKIALADLAGLKQKRETALAAFSKMENVRGNGNRYVYDSQNSWELRKKLTRAEGEAEVEDKDVNKVYDIAGFMKDYLLKKFNHDSLDNNGMDLNFSLHYRKNYNNAFWDGDEMAFGDGDGKLFIGFASSIDVIAHELMHGVTQFAANLQYYSQSGALNEHFSDVFGTIIKQRLLNQTTEDADWLIGNSIIGPDFPGIALRSMKAPGTANDFDSQPMHMDNYYTGNDDNQGVHINSGIPNKAFYLASIQLGLDATELIWFETLKRLWASANFNDMLEKILEVSTELVKHNQIPSTAIEIVQEAFAQVGLIKDSPNLSYHIEISGGLFPSNEILEGVIENSSLIKELEKNEFKNSTNALLRDGKQYKISLRSNKSVKAFTIDESELNNNLKILIDIAQSKKK